MNVVPSLSMVLARLKDGIEFFSGCSMNTSTWRANCRYFTAKPTEENPRGGEFVGRVLTRLELKGARNIKFRQVRAAESVIPYVLCGLYFLRC
jgi:hypothetical protein